MPSEPSLGAPPLPPPPVSADSVVRTEPWVNRYVCSTSSIFGSCRRSHSSVIAACSFSSSRLCARIFLSSSSCVASTRWSYQSMASSSSPSDVMARCRSTVSGRSSVAASCSPTLVGMIPPPAGSRGSARASQQRATGCLFLQLLPDRIQLLSRVDEVRVEIAAVVGEHAVARAVEDEERFHRGGLAERVGDVLEQGLDRGPSDEVLAVLGLQCEREVVDDVR